MDVLDAHHVKVVKKKIIKLVLASSLIIPVHKNVNRFFIDKN